MLVKDLMTPEVVSVRPDTSITDVAEILHKHSFSGLPVVDEHKTVLGMINERDFLASKAQIYLPTYIKLLQSLDYVGKDKRTLPYVAKQIEHFKAADIMNKHVLFVHPETSIEEVAEIFATRGNNPIAVTDHENKIKGIIARSDLLKPMLRSDSRREIQPIHSRSVDAQVEYLTKDFQSRFAYVTKARANIWLTTAIVLAIAGFLAGIFYVVDPNVFG
jgi:CBS domain-containing protein